MTPKTISLVALIAALPVAIDVAVDEAVDVDASVGGEHVVVRCKGGAKAGELDCGDLPADAKVHWDTASPKYLAVLASKGATTARDSQCACGPVAKSDCVVTVDGKARPAMAGEHLPAGSWSGACVPKACFELSDVIESKGLGYALPVACGGKPAAAKEAEPAVKE